MKSFKSIRIFVIFAILSCISVSCDKDIIEPDSEASVEVAGSQNYILPYNFDWEATTFNWMPYPAAQGQIPPPWIGQGSLVGVISPDMLGDRKKSDGWVLVYSTFSPTLANKNPYFMLYNKFRGLVRVFQYVNDLGSFANSTYIQDGMYHGSASLKLMNFADKDVVDVTTNSLGVDRVQPNPFNGAPLANHKWYFTQYEMAYDPSIVPTLSTTPPQMSFYFNSINIAEISLGGTIEAKVNGTIGASTSSSSGNLWNTVNSQAKSLGKGALTSSFEAMVKNTIDATGKNKVGVQPTKWKPLKVGMEAAMNAITGNIPGAAKNILSAIIGGSSSSAGQTANLTLNGTLTVKGTETTKGSLPSQPVSFYIPGSLQKNSSGGYNVQSYVPLYNKSFGLFNISAKPTVQIITKRTQGQNGINTYDTEYKIKPGTLNIQWNPVVNGADATIVSLTTEVLATFTGNIDMGLTYAMASLEDIYGQKAYSGRNSFRLIHHYDTLPAEETAAYIRISFVVRPKNGGPDAAIIKTFAVNKERSLIYM
uniref:Uncharacterized protein n=1 Tax=Roseihalotalea indica TaxID=2867963 RepID=A0AA49GRV4_9BACT|nr:hypothetical protein K4G66_27510 [Tunicatimonas sp. TK19036]